MCRYKEIHYEQKALTQLALAMSIFGSVGFFSRLTGLFAIELVFVRLVYIVIFFYDKIYLKPGIIIDYLF
ncbi:hypothetical protein BTH38_10555 [Bacillus toyonensis]|uniref:hypothetical protein n=1 Tax=Bacillus toyonensis TaxID=155322 RepID=UPI0005340E8D|nr:hypothetical protein [Bacillus toyonensis]MBJ7944695.1 hypothetical protein [Bacillus cereus group sp. N24]OSM13403.1 hypothetical protein BTH38_10555 [Bacillus toyonensis]